VARLARERALGDAEATMARFEIAGRGIETLQVEAGSWLTALGLGLEELGRVESLTRLACERLPNGTVIARDASTGVGYVVQLAEEQGDGSTDLTPGDELDIELIDEVPDAAGDGPLAQAASPLEACELALDLARSEVPAESGSVILVDGARLRFMAVLGPHADDLVGMRLAMGTGVAGYAMSRRRTVVLTDAPVDPRHCGEIDRLTGYRTRDIIAVPVADGDRMLGVIEMLNLPPGTRFSRQHIASLQRVAAALAERLSGAT
jgi:hypothetical protein